MRQSRAALPRIVSLGLLKRPALTTAVYWHGLLKLVQRATLIPRVADLPWVSTAQQCSCFRLERVPPNNSAPPPPPPNRPPCSKISTGVHLPRNKKQFKRLGRTLSRCMSSRSHILSGLPEMPSTTVGFASG